MSKAKMGDTRKGPLKHQPPLEIRKQTQLQKYFKSIISDKFQEQTIKATDKSIKSVEKILTKAIRKGQIIVKEQPSNLSTILIKQKIDEEIIRAEQLKKKREQIILAMEKLDMRMKRSGSQIVSSSSRILSNPEHLHLNANSILTKQEHQELVQKIQRAQQAQKKRQQEMLYNLQKKLEEQEKKIKQSEEQRFQTQKQLRKMRSQNNIAARKQENEEKKMFQLQSKKEIQSLKKKKFLHQHLQQKFNNSVVLPSLEEKKKKLKEIREISRDFNVKKIDEHQKKYLHERNKSMHNMNMKSRIAEQWAYKKPEKPERLTKVLEDELSTNKKYLQKQKKEIEQKRIRHQNYVRLLKEQHKPKTSTELQSQLQTRITKIHTKPRQINVDTRQQGLQNLRKAKKMKKQNSEIIMSASQVEQNASMQRSRLNYLKIKNDDGYYSQKRKQNLQKLLKSEGDLVQKEKKLKIENDKIQQALKRKQMLLKVNSQSIETRKEAADLMLEGIKAKMGLIQLAQ